MTLSELQAKMPELNGPIAWYLNNKKIPYKAPLFGEETISDVDAERALQLYNTEFAAKIEEARIAKEEEVKKRQVMAQMLITSGTERSCI